MFVFTAKLNRKSAVAAVVVLALLLIAVILLVSLRSIGGGKPAPEKTGITDASDAARYLAGLGWQVEPQPLEIRELVIPRSFSGVYADYAALQTKQGNQRKALKPGDAPQAVFCIAEDDEIEAAFALCNLHGLWKA